MLEHLPKKDKLEIGEYRVAVLVPCHNEELTIAQVVSRFQAVLSNAKVYVYDNRSTDRTVEHARNSGAIVRYETQPGKGSVVRRMFADIEADIYVLIDGDSTYEVDAAPRLIERLIKERLDMVVGTRHAAIENRRVFRLGHRSGNLFLTGVVKLLFGAQFRDMLSGYRVFSRRYVKSFPALSNGFEIETEFTIHALELNLPFAEEPTIYGSRPPGSESKLKTFTDGWRVLGTALLLFKEARPALFFTVIFSILCILAFVLGMPLLVTYLKTGLVPRFPTAILAASLVLLASLSLACGFILDSVSRGRKESKRMAYLNIALPYQD